MSTTVEATPPPARCSTRSTGPVVLVGHSYVGAVITEAVTYDKVAALIRTAAASST